MNSKTKNLAFIGVMTALIAVIAPISITLPFTPVPISFANLIIYICAAAIGWKRSTAAVILYLFIGAVGIPVFSKYASGFGYIAGATGGYLIGFIPCAFFTGMAADLFPKKRIIHCAGMVWGTIFCYLLGTIWLSITAELGFYEALAMGVLPYIPGDTIKIIISCLIGLKIRKQINAAI